MCKPNDRITTALNDLMDVKRMIEELQAEETALTDEIKAYMGDEETMLCGTYKVTYKEVASKRVDTAALRSLLGEEAIAPYTRIIITRRFAVN